MASETHTRSHLEMDTIRRDFPALHQSIGDSPLVYLDNAATTQKPQSVIDAISDYYQRDNANVHRGVHTLSQRATDAHEGTRDIARRFLGAQSNEEIVYTSGTTGAINLIAQCFAEYALGPGDEILLTEMEHHSNIVPWQLAAARTGSTVRFASVTERGELDMDDFSRLLSDKTKVVSFVHTSNSLGTVNPAEAIIQAARRVGAATVVDGAQAVQHGPVNVRDLDCDFFCLSAHKIYGPTGFGILYGKTDWLERLPPYQGGGDMIDTVSLSGSTFASPPYKFEAGTPNIAGSIGFGAALKYVSDLGIDAIADHEHSLVKSATEKLLEIDGVRIVGEARNKASVVSFLLGSTHPYDVGSILNQLGVAVRTGHHCTMPLMQKFNIPGTVRASFALYNTPAEVDRLVDAVKTAHRILN